MNILNTLAVLITCGVICAGCVSYPIIDEAIANLDANPVPIARRFNLPETPPLVLAPQSAELLIGEWHTGLLRPLCRSIGIVSSDEIYNYDENYKGVAQDYTFMADGSFYHYDSVQESATATILKKSGTWSYDSGVLTLHCTKEDLEFENHYLKSIGDSNWKRNTTIAINETVICRVEWFAHNEIVITAVEEKPSPQLGSRENIKVDGYGVKTKRIILVFGMKEGREAGTVSETVYPPMHLKKIK